MTRLHLNKSVLTDLAMQGNIERSITNETTEQ